ncbi:MAG: hypothetical protein AAB538_00755, partial [Patescibacteria group bacterium]
SVVRASENLQREDLTPIEEARIYRRLVSELGMTLEKAGQMTGKSPGVVKRRIDLLRMPDKFQNALHEKKIGIAVAESLWGCPDDNYRDYLLEMAVEHGITDAVARMWVDDYKKSLRTKAHGTAGGIGGMSVFEDNPIYVTCDACRGPSELPKIKNLRICSACYQAVIDNLRA